MATKNQYIYRKKYKNIKLKYIKANLNLKFCDFFTKD